MLVVLDINVIYQALKSNTGASHLILNLVRKEKLEIAVSIPVFEEYRDLLLREKSLKDLDLDKKDIEAILDFLVYSALQVEVHFILRPNLQDEKDNIFVELAFSSNARYLITSNIRDFVNNANLKFDGFEVITPAQFIKQWRLTHAI